MSDEPTVVPVVIDAATQVNDQGQLLIRLSTVGGSITLALDALELGEHGEEHFTNLMHGIEVMVHTFAAEWFDLVKMAVKIQFEELS